MHSGIYNKRSPSGGWRNSRPNTTPSFRGRRDCSPDEHPRGRGHATLPHFGQTMLTAPRGTRRRHQLQLHSIGPQKRQSTNLVQAVDRRPRHLAGRVCPGPDMEEAHHRRRGYVTVAAALAGGQRRGQIAWGLLVPAGAEHVELWARSQYATTSWVVMTVRPNALNTDNMTRVLAKVANCVLL